MQGIRESAGWGPASWWPRAISSSSRTQTDPHPSQGTGGAASLSVGGCQTEKGIVEWVTREPLLSTECRAIPQIDRKGYRSPVTECLRSIGIQVRFPRCAGELGNLHSA